MREFEKSDYGIALVREEQGEIVFGREEKKEKKIKKKRKKKTFDEMLTDSLVRLERFR